MEKMDAPTLSPSIAQPTIANRAMFKTTVANPAMAEIATHLPV